MQTVFQLTLNELTMDFLQSVKQLFKEKNTRVKLTIEPLQDETDYLLSTEANRKMLEKSLKSKEGYVFTMDEFKQISKELQKGNKIHFSKLRKEKILL